MSHEPKAIRVSAGAKKGMFVESFHTFGLRLTWTPGKARLYKSERGLREALERLSRQYEFEGEAVEVAE